MKTKLLCTFCQNDDKTIQSSIDYINKVNRMEPNRFFILGTEEEVIITYNVIVPFKMPRYTIVAHRKKETNTIYTINALNYLIIRENNGRLDSSYEVDWTKFRNKIILTTGRTLKIVDTFLKKILEN